MARGEKYGDEIKERAYAEYAASGSVGHVARTLNVPYSTVKGWIKNKPPDELDGMRNDKKAEFIESANRIIEKGMRLLEHRFSMALDREEELENIIDEIAKSGEDIISDKTKITVINKLKALLVYDPKAISVAIGTIYDKRDRAGGNKDENENGGVIFMPAVKDGKEV